MSTVPAHAYRLACGDIFTGPPGLREGSLAKCAIHGDARIAGFGISLYRLFNPDYAPDLLDDEADST